MKRVSLFEKKTVNLSKTQSSIELNKEGRTIPRKVKYVDKIKETEILNFEHKMETYASFVRQSGKWKEEENINDPKNKEYYPDKYNREIKGSMWDGKQTSRSFFSEGQPIVFNKRFEGAHEKLWVHGIPSRVNTMLEAQPIRIQTSHYYSNQQQFAPAERPKTAPQPMGVSDAISITSPSRISSQDVAKQVEHRGVPSWSRNHCWSSSTDFMSTGRSFEDEAQSMMTAMSGTYSSPSRVPRSDFDKLSSFRILEPFLETMVPDERLTELLGDREAKLLSASSFRKTQTLPLPSLNNTKKLDTSTTSLSSLQEFERQSSFSAQGVRFLDSFDNPKDRHSSPASPASLSRPSSPLPVALMHQDSHESITAAQSLISARLKRLKSLNKKKLKKQPYSRVDADTQQRQCCWLGYVHMFLHALAYRRLLKRKKKLQHMDCAVRKIQSFWRIRRMKAIVQAMLIIRTVFRSKCRRIQKTLAGRRLLLFLTHMKSLNFWTRAAIKYRWRIVKLQRMVRTFQSVDKARLELLSRAWDRHYAMREAELKLGLEPKKVLPKDTQQMNFKTTAAQKQMVFSKEKASLLTIRQISESEKMYILRNYLNERRLAFKDTLSTQAGKQNSKELKMSHMVDIINGTLDPIRVMNIDPANNMRIMPLLTGPREAERFQAFVDSAIFRSKKKR